MRCLREGSGIVALGVRSATSDHRTGISTPSRGFRSFLTSVIDSPPAASADADGPDSSGQRGPLWAWERGEIVGKIEVVGATVVEFDPTGSMLAVARFDGIVEIRQVPGGERVLRFPAYSGAVGDLAFSPDGTRIATSGEDATVRLFDAAGGEQQLVLRGHGFLVSGVAFSPDGTRLASASPDGVVRVWALDLDDLIRIARTEVTRELSDDECRQYLHLQGGCA
jgi:WD40 repeat protein